MKNIKTLIKIYWQQFWDWMQRQPEICQHKQKEITSQQKSNIKIGKICIIETCENCGEVFMRYENNTTKK